MVVLLMTLFFGSIVILGYTYLLYPILIKFISLFFKEKYFQQNNFPTISILISVYNEEKVIKQKIENIANLNYEFAKIEVLIGSDCSIDNTNKILEECKKEYTWLSLYLFNERRGKALVLNDLVGYSKNEVIVFSDADTVFDKNILKFLSSHFINPKVGGVSGRIVLSEPEENFNRSIEEKIYWEYEDFIKKSEGKCGILVSANGGNYSVRRDLFVNIPVDKAVTDDLFTTLAILKQAYKFLFDYNAVAFEDVANEVIDEYKRKTRYSATNFQTLAYFKGLMFNKNLLISLALWSHKIFRWLTPILFFLILFLIFYFLIIISSLISSYTYNWLFICLLYLAIFFKNIKSGLGFLHFLFISL